MNIYSNPIEEFEKQISAFFGASYGIAVDSCTHGIELCIRNGIYKSMISPKRTYVSIPMLAYKLNIPLMWCDVDWGGEYYPVTPNIYDAAVLWRQNSYLPGSFMCISFQHQKHLSLGRGGMILCDDRAAAWQLKKMSYDGRLPNIPWREQDIITMGYHYYMTPETAELGLKKLPDAIATTSRKWAINDWPDISKFKIFQ